MSEYDKAKIRAIVDIWIRAYREGRVSLIRFLKAMRATVRDAEDSGLLEAGRMKRKSFSSNQTG